MAFCKNVLHSKFTGTKNNAKTTLPGETEEILPSKDTLVQEITLLMTFGFKWEVCCPDPTATLNLKHTETAESPFWLYEYKNDRSQFEHSKNLPASPNPKILATDHTTLNISGNKFKTRCPLAPKMSSFGGWVWYWAHWDDSVICSCQEAGRVQHSASTRKQQSKATKTYFISAWTKKVCTG